jgi:ribose transport system substrate-binding protein
MHRVVGFLLISALLALSGCGSSGHAGEKYYLVATNVKIPYWQTAAAGLAKSAAELGVQAQMVGPDTYDPKAQAEEFRRVLGTKPAGIMVSAADPELLRQPISDAIAAGVPVITMDSDAPGSQRLVFVGTNNYQAGMTGGKLLTQQLKGKGNVVVFTIPAQANLEERLRGYRDSLANSPGVNIAQVLDVHGSPEAAFDQTKQLLESNKTPIQAFVCLEALACKEVADVLERKNVHDKVVIAMDTDDATLGWIDKGVITATIAQRPYTMAYFGLKLVDDLKHHRPKPLNAHWDQILSSPIPSVVDTGATLVDRSNLAQIRRLMGSQATDAAK